MPPQSYTSVRPIAYRVPTLTHYATNNANGSARLMHGIPPGTVPASWRVALQGEKADKDTLLANAELLHQTYRFLAAIKDARDFLAHQQLLKAHELKLFVGPEFCFRPSDPALAYSFKEYQAFRKVMAATLAHDQLFTHWLVICGTFLWEQTSVGGIRPTLSAVHQATGKKVYYNTAVMIGIQADSTATSQVDKTFTSSTDGMPHFADPSLGEDAPAYLRKTRRSAVQPRIFKMGNLNIGLDICLEHVRNLRVLRKELFSRHQRLGRDYKIDVHVLVAAGKLLEEWSTACRIGGLRFRVDGYIDANHVALERAGVVCERVGRYVKGSLDANGDFHYDFAISSPGRQDGAAFAMDRIHATAGVTYGGGHDLRIPMPANASPTLWNSQFQGSDIFNEIRLD